MLKKHYREYFGKLPGEKYIFFESGGRGDWEEGEVDTPQKLPINHPLRYLVWLLITRWGMGRVMTSLGHVVHVFVLVCLPVFVTVRVCARDRVHGVGLVHVIMLVIVGGNVCVWL